ncbi:hypothetical protein [Brevundimonas sp. GCM10030266]|uniref:hypothetical protein n=1 Tax=Brevundimonas sp. GCM10030266 TaxID=3273386 RepID=UPI00360915A1
MSIWGLVAAAVIAVQGDPADRGVVEINSLSIPFTFDREAVERLIPRLPQGASVYLQCMGYGADGRLTDCTVDLQPQGQGFEAAVDAFTSSVRVNGERVDLSRGDKVGLLWIQLTFWNWSQKPSSPCRPPGCTGTPAPPPPRDH